MGVADIMPLRLWWSNMALKLSKVQGLIVVSPREPVEVRKVLLALYWISKLLVTPLHHTPEDLTQKPQSHQQIEHTSSNASLSGAIACKTTSAALMVGTVSKEFHSMTFSKDAAWVPHLHAASGLGLKEGVMHLLHMQVQLACG